MSGDKTMTKARWLTILTDRHASNESSEAEDLIGQLRLHQIELELQNQQLRDAHERLEQSRGQYADLYDHAPIAYYTLDRKGLIQQLNLTAAAWMGLERRWLVGRPLANALGCVRAQDLATHFEECARTGRPTATAMPLKVDGALIAAQVMSVPLFGAAGMVTGFRTTVIDVTPLRLAEQRAAAAQARAEAAEARAVALAEVSAELAARLPGELTLPALARLAVPRFAAWCVVEVGNQGVAVAYLGSLPSDISDVLDQLEAGAGSLLLSQFLASREPGSYLTAPIGGPQNLAGSIVFGRELPYQDADQNLAQELGRLIGLSLQRERTHEELQRALQTRNDILCVVSHDLQNSLEAVRIHAQQLLKRTNDPAVQNIARSSETMVRFVREILDLGRIDSGVFTMRPASEEVGNLVRDAIAMIEPLAQAASVRLERQMPDWLVVRCDRTRTVQVLGNLLANAVKFAPGSVVEIAVTAESDRAVFAVKDHGPGIAPHDLHRVFERGFRAPSGIAGTGMGLFIAKTIVEAQGGTIWAESTPGQGSSFHFSLPRSV
jgi:PAS domain S-box-containing protein